MLTSKIHNLPIYLLFSNFSLSVSLYIYILIYLFHVLLKSKAYFICVFVFFLRTHVVHTTKEHSFFMLCCLRWHVLCHIWRKKNNFHLRSRTSTQVPHNVHITWLYMYILFIKWTSFVTYVFAIKTSNTFLCSFIDVLNHDSVLLLLQFSL
jgi:hypothetical protein